MRKLGEVWNTQHHANPLIICDSQAEYGGWDTFEHEIVDLGDAEIQLTGSPACIVRGGIYGYVDVFAFDDGNLALVNVEGQDIDVTTHAAILNTPGREVGQVAVPSGSLAIGIAYLPLPQPEDTNAEELLIVPDTATRYTVTVAAGVGGMEEPGVRAHLRPSES
jgi:hypothetical protein